MNPLTSYHLHTYIEGVKVYRTSHYTWTADFGDRGLFNVRDAQLAADVIRASESLRVTITPEK